MFDRMGDSAPKPALYGNDYKKVTLQMMLDHNINEFTQDFEELSTAAAKQHGLKKAMGNMKAGRTGEENMDMPVIQVIQLENRAQVP